MWVFINYDKLKNCRTKMKNRKRRRKPPFPSSKTPDQLIQLDWTRLELPQNIPIPVNHEDRTRRYTRARGQDMGWNAGCQHDGNRLIYG
mgnify:CR=1 FL=1